MVHGSWFTIQVRDSQFRVDGSRFKVHGSVDVSPEVQHRADILSDSL